MIESRKKILWAEDEDTLREIMCELITEDGYECIHAHDGLIAKEILKVQKVDLIISDFNMPGMNGAELLFWCRENDIHTPFLFVTAASERLPIENLALNDCCTSVLNKPFSIETLLSEIEKSMSRQHEFECEGKVHPAARADFTNIFPYQHYK